VAERTYPDGLTHVHSGKVRDLYRTGDGRLLIVASDRISAFDHILSPTIPDKGRILTAMTVWWFDQLATIVGNHLRSVDDPAIPRQWRGRAMLCTALDMVPVEAVARGYLAGSGLLDYRASGAVCGVALPAGLTDGDRLPEPIFTPATKAEIGGHDENIDFERAAEIIGDRPLMEELRRASIELYQHAAAHAEARGIILADTKFEFGASPGAEVVLGDEVFTPDSSRFWPTDEYEPGRPQRSFDKQYLRDWLDQIGWDHTPPAPELPEEVVANTRAKYLEAYERITGRTLD
jgi:phosphoribosylaminoimidazole-succinocarboxamide synthase